MFIEKSKWGKNSKLDCYHFPPSNCIEQNSIDGWLHTILKSLLSKGCVQVHTIHNESMTQDKRNTSLRWDADILV